MVSTLRAVSAATIELDEGENHAILTEDFASVFCVDEGKDQVNLAEDSPSKISVTSNTIL